MELFMNDLEITRTAERLVMARGVGTVDFVTMKIRVMEEIGDDGNQTYGENILKEVERILFEA